MKIFLKTLFFLFFLSAPLAIQAQSSNFNSLQEGSSGQEVFILQSNLQEIGYFPITTKLTNYFGAITKEAVIAFQKANNLSSVGIFGPRTNEVLAQVTRPTTEARSKIALPLYIYPSANEANWAAVIKAGTKVDFIVANINSGPGTSAQTAWTNMINKAVAAGIKVYGYVNADYRTKSGSTVDAQVNAWFKFYPQVTGIFFDQVSPGAKELPYYKSRYDYVKSKNKNFKVVINPGTVTDEGYMKVSDINVLFEGTYASWLTKAIPAWVANYPKERFYTVVYSVSSEEKMKEVVKIAKDRNFGRMFITNATTASAALPPYFQAELAEIDAANIISVNGVCGSSNGATTSTVPVSNLCATGAASTVAGSGPWTWNCSGINGGVTVGCSAQKTVTATVAKSGLPLYIFPSATESNWAAAIAAGGSKIDFIVANVNSGPGTSAQTAWTNMIKKAVDAGIKVYGYVDTNFASKSGATVESQVAQWFQFYPQVTGIFFDRVPAGEPQLPYYQARYNYVKNINSNYKVVINPRTMTVEGYMAASDVSTVFESLYSSWITKTTPSWVYNYSKERFYAIVYDVPTETTMKDVVRTAKARNFGRIFVTNATGPSSPLPSYFEIELAEIVGTTTPVIFPVPSSTPAPSTSPSPLNSRTFIEDTALSVRNPERGLYYPINLFSNTLADCQSAVRKGYTIVYTKAILPKTADLTQALSNGGEVFAGNYISKIRDGLAAVRLCGAKAIVRFYYLKDDSSSQDPSIGIIKGHLTQIKSVLAENSDVVMVFQAGLIGAWGEWHGSNLADSATARADILSSLLNALPTNRMVQVRTPGKRHQVFSGTATINSANAIGGTALGAPIPFSGTNTARTGHHDDCFMGTLRNYGTYSTFGSSAYNQEVAYVAQNTRFTPMGGESCRFAKRNATTLVYTYDPTETYRYTDRAHIRARAKKEMATMHWSYLNGTYSEEVRDSMGGNAGLALIDPFADPLSNSNSGARTVADHNCPDGVFDSSACIYEGFYPEMLRRLGYRLVLLNSSFSSQVRSEGPMQINFALRNIGFAAMFNTRPVYLVLHNGFNRYNIHLTGVDPRTWEPKSDVNGTSIVDSTSIINVSKQVNLPANMAPGTYSVSLWLPDQATSLQSRPQYSVRFANTGTWNSTLGLNLLAVDAVVVSP